MSEKRPYNTCCSPYAGALLELIEAVEAKADLGKRRQITVSPRMEDALVTGKQLLLDASSGDHDA